MMRRMMTERGRGMLAVVLVGSLLAMFAVALPVIADADPNPERTFSMDVVAPGEEFEVTVTFAAPADDFNDIRLNDIAPAGWIVTVDANWVDPVPTEALSPETNEAEFRWTTESYDEGQVFQVKYEVLVPAEAEPGIFYFAGDMEYRIADSDPHFEDIGGQIGLLVESPTGEVSLRARTPPETGCMRLIKVFDPDDTEFPHDQIEVRVVGPDDFGETYTLRAVNDWEEHICDIPVGTYLVEELTVVPGWIPTYDPDTRELEVVSGETATMTITNTHSVIGVSVSPSDIDFGETTPGETKSGATIMVTNTGSLPIDVRAELDEDTVYNDVEDHFYTDALWLAGGEASGRTGDDLGSWTAGDLGLESVESGDSEDVTTAVVCPAEMYPDTEYTGKLLFTASASD